MGGGERADDVEGAGLDGGEIGLGVVAFVKDQGDGLERVGDGAAAGGELAAEVLEGGRVGALAGVGAVQQGQVGAGGDEQGEADDAQGGAALLAVAALGEGGLVVEGVVEGEEVGGVEEHLAQVDLEVESALAAEETLRNQQSLLRDSQGTTREAIGLAEHRFGAGMGDIFSILALRRSILETESAVLALQRASPDFSPEVENKAVFRGIIGLL